MKINIFLFGILLCLNSFGAEWKKVNPTTIEISGNFNKNEIQNLNTVWNDDINTIIVKESRNNEIDLSVGNFLKDKKYDLTIDGLCSISCVENLLLPATTVKIKNGCLRVSEKASDALKKLDKNDIVSLDNLKPTKEEQNQFAESLKDWKKYQEELFKLKNIKPIFYADHDLVRKGLLYFPSTMILDMSGLKFQGEVNLECISKSESTAYYFK